MLMAIFVVVGTVTLPGIEVNNSNNLSNNSFFGIMNTIGGGGLRQFSLVSLGISPFITASLVMTFLQTKLCPPIYRLYHSGPAGRVKINYITYGITLFFALIQGMVLIQTLIRQDSSQTAYSISIKDGFNNVLFIWIVLPLVLVAGTFFSIFVSELITNKGVGNGTSMLILSGSVISLPQMFTSAWSIWIQARYGTELFKGIVYFIAFILIFVAMVFMVSFFYQAERRVPIQQTGVGRAKNIKDLSYLPIKLNPSGVMPIIFASMLITFPMMIVNLINDLAPSDGTRWMITNFQLTKPIGLTIYAAATFLITIFLSIQQAKIDKIVEDFNKASTFIPGIRPGEQTEDYLLAIVVRLSVFSAFYLTILGSSQYFVSMFISAQYQPLVMNLVSIMIITTVSIETIQQIEARRKVQNVVRTNDGKKSQEHENKKEVEKEEKQGSSILW